MALENKVCFGQSELMKAEGNNFIEAETSTNRELNASSSIGAYVLTIVLLVVAAATIVVATSWLFYLPFGNGIRQVVLNTFLGMLLSLPVLVSLWTVLGGQAWFIRIPLASLALLVLFGIYAVTNICLGMPAEVLWLFAGVTLLVTTSVQISFWTIRVWQGVTISAQGAKSGDKMQFTIKHLLITTTIFAFLTPLLRWFTTFEGFQDVFSRIPLNVVLGFCGIFIVVLVFLALFSVLIVFLPKLRVWCLGILVLGIATLPLVVVPSVLFVLSDRFTDQAWMDIAANVVAFSASNAVTMIVVLSMYYALGFRLRKRVA